MNPGLILTTAPSREVADRLAQTLVSDRLAACVSILPIHSVYRWEGAIQSEPEWQLLIKADLDHFQAVADRLQFLHPYDLPEIIAIPIIQGSAAYMNWLASELPPLSPAQQN